jgi:hypothetical protein
MGGKMDMTRTRQPRLDNQLMRALREGSGALPLDLNRLHDYLQLIGGLLSEKAQEREPDWAAELAAGAEIETLQGLEHAVVEKAMDVPARTLGGVLTKLSIWASLEAGEEAGTPSHRDKLVDSVRRDIQRIARISAVGGGRVGPY